MTVSQENEFGDKNNLEKGQKSALFAGLAFLLYIDQVEGEGWVDKNAALRGWAVFTSH